MSFTLEVKNEIKKLPKDRDEKKEFLRETFLSNGSINNPEKEYHLEIVSDSNEIALVIADLLKGYGIVAKVIEKKYNYITYIKEAESIALFLNIIGAHKALLEFENIKVTHEMNNQINRVVNCETANLSKIINASIRQIEAINKIKDTVGLKSLPDNLREIAELRLKNPDIGLLELGSLLSPPLGKSGVNHRLKKIEEIASEIS
jgi:DNA-binding protein WhiA